MLAPISEVIYCGAADNQIPFIRTGHKRELLAMGFLR
jgi:hypothetical protein